MPVNDNYVNVASYRGPVHKCEHCANATLPLPLRSFCKFCLTNGYIAQCLKCDGTGSIQGIAPWDRASEHHSTCDICGGVGVLPAREPVDQPPVKARPETKPAEAKKEQVGKPEAAKKKEVTEERKTTVVTAPTVVVEEKKEEEGKDWLSVPS